VSNYRLANADKDIPDVLPEPQQREKLISGVTYPLPQAGDSSVVLQVDLLLDDTGKAEVQSTQVLQGNPTIAPDQLAQTILQNWEFTPAYQAGQPVYSLLRVEFRIVPQAN
jgi:outer membrane biosynthesis protein TonB